METWHWSAGIWFDFMETVGIVGSLIFTAISLRSEVKTQRIANLFAVTANHLEVWKIFLNNEKMARVFDETPDLVKHPVTPMEETFVALVIAHVSSVYYAVDHQLIVNPNGLRHDVGQFLSLPVPQAVWEKIKAVQNDDFAAFVESCRQGK